MSTNINNAYLIHTQDLTELTKLANRLEEIYRATLADDVVEHLRLTLIWWNGLYKESMLQRLQEASLPANEVNAFLSTVLREMLPTRIDSPIRACTSEEIAGIAHILKQKPALHPMKDILLEVARLLLENLGTVPSITFVPGHDGMTYMKLFEPTPSMTHWLEAMKADRFDYTDATEMDVRDFGYEFRKCVQGLPKEEAEMLCAEAQTKRGNHWEAAMQTFHTSTFHNMGLQRSFNTPHIEALVAAKVVDMIFINA